MSALTATEFLPLMAPDELDIMTCSVDDIVHQFAETWRAIIAATKANLTILGQDPCDLGRARAIRALATAGRILRTVQSAHIQLYRLAHPGERVPRSATRANSPTYEQLTESGRAARELRKIGRAREQQQKTTRRTTQARNQSHSVQSTGFSLPTHPRTQTSALTSSSRVQSTGFSLPTRPRTKDSAPSTATAPSSPSSQSPIRNPQSSIDNSQSPIRNPQSSIAKHVLDLLEHPPSLSDQSIAKYLSNRSLLEKYIAPPVATPFVQSLINQSATRNRQSAIDNPQSSIENPQSPIPLSRAERRRQGRRLKRRPPPS